MIKPRLWEVCDKIMVWGFYVTIFFIPTSIAILEFCFLTMLLAYIIKRASMFYHARQGKGGGIAFKTALFLKTFRPVATPLNKPLALIIIVILSGLFFSPDPFFSFQKILSRFVHPIMLYFMFIEVMNSKKRFDHFIYFLLITCSIVIADAAVQYFIKESVIFRHSLSDGRLTAMFRHPNDLATFLVTVLPVLFCLAFMPLGKAIKGGAFSAESLRLPKNRVALFALFFGALFVLGMTFSRSGWLAFSAGILLLCLMTKRLPQLLWGLLVIVLFWGIFLPDALRTRSDIVVVPNPFGVFVSSSKPAVVGYRHHKGDRIFLPLKSFVYSGFFSVTGRMQYWHSAWNVIKKYPVFGCGYNAYVMTITKMGLAPYEYPHNFCLHIMAESGVLGLLAFLWVIVVLFK
jgi:hypothetical protein